MRIPHLSAVLATVLLTATPSISAFAEPAPVAHETQAHTSAPAPDVRVASDAEQYAAREAKDAEAAKFQGGSEVIVIGVSSVTLALAIVLLVILL